MHRFLIRLENRGYAPKDTINVMIELRKQVNQFDSVVKNLRVSQKALEFDLYTIDDNDKVKSLAKLEKEFGNLLEEKDLEIDQLPQSKEKVIDLGIELFNQERFWECHETVEQIWRKEEKGPEKDVQQGFILAASALVHFQKNENDVCLGMVPRALAKLDQWSKPWYLGLNVAKLKEKLEKLEESRSVSTFKI